MSEHTLSTTPTLRRVHFDDEPDREASDNCASSVEGLVNPVTPAKETVPPLEITLVYPPEIPPHVDISDDTIVHRYRQAPPSYLLGYIVDPDEVYESAVKAGTQEETREATLEAYLAFIRDQAGITWGNGVRAYNIGRLRRWLFWIRSSPSREETLAVSQCDKDDFRDAMGANADPWLIVIHHPKVRPYLCQMVTNLLL
ncbi:hypothetical protein GGG16DRAFT_48913 [Schizophyllum commune]